MELERALIQNQLVTRDGVLKLLNTTLIETELKMTLEKNTDPHKFATTVFNRMVWKLVKEVETAN